MGAPSLVGVLLVDSGGHRGPVASTSARRNRNHESTRPSDHRADALSVGTRRVVDRFDVGGRRVVAGRGRCFLARSPFKVAQSVLLVGSRLAGDQAVRLQPQELSPGRPDPAWRRAEAALAKHRGDRRGGDIDPELQEFASDPEVAPPRVLPPEAKDQTLDRGIERRTTRSPGPATTPPQEVSVPPGERVRADEEAPPPVPGEQPGSRCQPRPIGSSEVRSRPSPTKDPQLVAEDGGFDIPLIDATADEQTEQPAEEPV